jgi:hypothetical protein
MTFGNSEAAVATAEMIRIGGNWHAAWRRTVFQLDIDELRQRDI